MNDAWIMDLGREALKTMLLLSGPLLMAALLTGLAVSIFQALTQINEATLTFIPKILAVAGMLMIIGPWMLRVMSSFAINLFENIDIYLR